MNQLSSRGRISLNSAASGRRVTKRSSPEDWVRRLLIAFACFWLIVGIVLPLMDVVHRATHIELVVKIEEPTEQEKAEDDFRGQINVAGHAVLLMMEEGKKEVLYIDNKPVKTRRRKAEVSGVYVELGDERIERVVCDLARPDPMSEDVLAVKPIEVVRTEGQRWQVSGELLPIGENLVVIGRSGMGKSVLIKNLIGLLQPDDGSISIDGEEIVGLDPIGWRRIRRRFGMLFQGAALFDSMSVAENVAFPLTAHSRIPAEEIQALVDEKLALVGMSGYQQRRPAELSGGMKKRVGLARALAMDPDIMLYDEPTTGLDPIMGGVIDRLIVRMNKKFHVTSITITHDMRSAYRIADRIAMLHQGVIEQIGSPDEIRGTRNEVVRSFIQGAHA